ncbi:MAG: phosphate ABC transporter permease subunit PstC [Acidobacteria bacterium]|nr:phosphate ABC transporter permease subunit PstC [Acidobacteriota bacterium]
MSALPEEPRLVGVPGLDPQRLKRPSGTAGPHAASPDGAKPIVQPAKAEARPPLEIPTPSRFADPLFTSLILLAAISLFAIVGLIVMSLVTRSRESLQQFGWRFFVQSVWDPVAGQFGALPFIYGTLVSSLLALALAVPLGVGVALFNTEVCPRRLRSLLSFTVELLAAIPSVIYGLWGIFVLAPVLRKFVEPWLKANLGWTGIFTGPPFGIGMLAAGLILAIMVIPIVASITREVVMAVPSQQREAALALGATRWEMLRISVLRNARVGIMGGVILGLGRAIGETMAVTMVIGNTPQISKSLLAPGDTLASVIANQFSEATGSIYLGALVEIGLALFIITLIVNTLARMLVWSVTRGMPSRAHA